MLPHLARTLALAIGAAAMASPTRAQTPDQDRLTLAGAALSGLQTVSKTGSVYSLAFRAPGIGVDYRIDANSPEVRAGLIRVWEKFSDCYPVTVGGATFHDLTNHNYRPLNLVPFCTMTGDAIVGTKVVLEYADHVPGCGVRHRRHTFELQGIVLSITVEDIDQSLVYDGGYTGFYVGPTGGTEDPHLVQMQGALSTALILFERGDEHYLLGSALDVTRSNASDWLMPTALFLAPSADSIDFAMDTSARYYPNSAGHLSAPVRDTWRVAISKRLVDVMLAPSQPPSPYRPLLEPRTVVLFAQEPTTWDAYRSHLEQLVSWGLDDLAVYCFSFWSDSAVDPPAFCNQGPDWVPARDELRFKKLTQSAHELGVPFGVYTSFATMPLTAPSWVYDPSQIACASNGQYKVSLQLGTPVIASSASAVHATREMLAVKQN